MSTKTKARRVGGDWVESVDPRSGKIYYANVVTKETSWTMPAEVKAYQDRKALGGRGSISRSNSSRSSVERKHRGDKKEKSSHHGDHHTEKSHRKKEKEKADQWLERQDPRTGKRYFYNPKLKQTSWEKPDNTVSALDGNQGAGSWLPRVDPRTNRTFYFNSVTRMTSWTNPDEEMEKEKSPTSSSGKSSKPKKPSKPTAPTPKKRISNTPEEEDQPAYESTPSAPTNRTSARVSIRLGDIPSANEKGNRLSMAESVRMKKAEITGDLPEVAQTDALVDRFAKLRALRNRAQPDVYVEEEQVQDKQIDLDDLTATALGEVNYDLDIRQYAQEHLKLRRKGGWGSKKNVSVEQLLSWEAERIKEPLHGLTDSALIHDSVLAFGNILCYMGDKATKAPMLNANKVFRITVSCPEELRDEVYVQLIKQTTNNPNPQSCNKGWELIVLCAGLFPPSSKLDRYLLSYIKRGTRDDRFARLAEYALVRLQRTIDLGPRTEIPTDIEIQSACDVSPITVRIHMLDGSITPVEAESWTTVNDLNNVMANVLKIKDGTPFKLFEISNLDEERALEDDDRILDILAYWERERKMAKRAKDAPSFQFVYKVRLFFDIREDDVHAVEVAYHQAVHDVTDSRYPCSEDDCLRLAALQAQQRFGDYDGRDVFGSELSAFLPAKYYHPDVEDALKAAIMETYKLLRGYDSQEAMNNYLDYVKAWKIYGSAYFFVEPQNIKAELPQDVVLAVNAQGVLIVDPQTKAFLSEYPYSEVVTWGHSSVTFVLVVGNLFHQNKLFFKTDQGAEINSLIHAYVNRLVEE